MSALVAGVVWPTDGSGRPAADLAPVVDDLHRRVAAVPAGRLREVAVTAGLAPSEMAGRAFLHEAAESLRDPAGSHLSRVEWDGVAYMVAVGGDKMCLHWDFLVALSRAGLC